MHPGDRKAAMRCDSWRGDRTKGWTGKHRQAPHRATFLPLQHWPVDNASKTPFAVIESGHQVAAERQGFIAPVPPGRHAYGQITAGGTLRELQNRLSG